MESIIPSRYPILRLRKCVLALTVGLAAILLPAAVAFAQLENQDQINSAVKAYEASTKQAVENIPDSEVMKRREDDLDRLSRAKTDADAAQKAAEATADAGKIDKAKKAATKAKELEEAARTLADHARTFETSEADKERAQEYREALEKRRAAKLAMKELEAELKPKVDDRRALSADKELDNEINRLRVRIGRAETTDHQRIRRGVDALLAHDSQCLDRLAEATAPSARPVRCRSPSSLPTMTAIRSSKNWMPNSKKP